MPRIMGNVCISRHLFRCGGLSLLVCGKGKITNVISLYLSLHLSPSLRLVCLAQDTLHKKNGQPQAVSQSRAVCVAILAFAQLQAFRSFRRGRIFSSIFLVSLPDIKLP